MRRRAKVSINIRVDADKIVRHVLVAALVLYALWSGAPGSVLAQLVPLMRWLH
jgi:hypothetical protein